MKSQLIKASQQLTADSRQRTEKNNPSTAAIRRRLSPLNYGLKLLIFLLAICIAARGVNAQQAPQLDVHVHVIGDWWSIPDTGGGAGPMTFRLDAGRTYLIQGLKGWSVAFSINDAAGIDAGDIVKGPMLVEPPVVEILPAPRHNLPGESLRITLPPLKLVTLDIHPAYGAYTVSGVPMEWTGRRTVFLPAGRFSIQGQAGWRVELKVDDDGVDAVETVPAPLGRTFHRLSTENFTLSSGAPEAARIIFAIPPEAGAYSIENVLPAGSGNRTAWLTAGNYTLISETPAKAPETAPETPVETPADAPADAPAEAPADDGRWKISFLLSEAGIANVSAAGELPPGATLKHESRTITLEMPRQPRQNSPDTALFTFSQLNRRTFRRGETIRLTVVLNTAQPLDARFRLLARTVPPADPASIELFSQQWNAPAGRHSRNFDIESAALAPGEYDLIASMNGQASNATHVYIARGEQERPTRFAICSYSHPDPVFAEKHLFNAVEYEQFGPETLAVRCEQRSRQRYLDLWNDTLAQPYELNQNIPRCQKLLEEFTRYGLDALLQYPAEGQFFHPGTCLVDLHVRDAAARGAALIAQTAREFDVFRGIAIGREIVWPRHPDVYLDDRCPCCEQAFFEQTGAPVPRTPAEPDIWRQWMLYKQQGVAGFFEHVGQRIAEIKPKVKVASQQGNRSFNVADGGYPPVNNKPLTLSTACWEPELYGSLTSVLGHEFVRMSPQHTPYWPLIPTTNAGRPWMLGEEARHAIYLAVSRQTEGVSHLAGSAAPDTPHFAAIIGGEVHPNLTRHGDMLLQLRRDTKNEIAVLFSFEEQHRNCSMEDRLPYGRSSRHVETVAFALFGLLRNQFQAGLITEEDILGGKLEGRPALLIAGVTAMRPDVQQRIEAYAAAGGRVFTDAQTTVEIAGSVKINSSFDAFRRRQINGRDVDDTWPSDDRLYIGDILPVIEETFKNAAARRARANTTQAVTTLLKAGKGEYVWVVNDNLAMGNMSPEGTGYRAMPLELALQLPAAPAIYNVFSGRRMEAASVELELAPGDARLFACLPTDPARIDLSATVQKEGNRLYLTWRADVLSANNTRIAAALPVQVTVLDPQGRTAANLYRSTTPDAPAAGKYLLPLNFAAGTWSVRATSLLGGASSNAQVDAPAPGGIFVKELGDVLPIRDADAINQTLHEARAVVIIIGNTSYMKTVESVAAKLRELGKQVDIRLASELRRQRLDTTFGRGMHRRWCENIGGPLTDVVRPAVIIGTPVDNAFIADVMLDSEITSHFVTPDYPGPGRGLLIHLWKPFSFTQNSIVVTGSDAAGIAKAAERLTAGL